RAIRDTVGSAAAPAANCRNLRRGSFIKPSRACKAVAFYPRNSSFQRRASVSCWPSATSLNPGNPLEDRNRLAHDDFHLGPRQKSLDVRRTVALRAYADRKQTSAVSTNALIHAEF